MDTSGQLRTALQAQAQTMDDLDPATATSLDDLAACLRQVHLLADQPTYRALEQQTAHENGFLPGTRLRRVRLTRTTISDVLTGRKFPGKAFLLTFVDACGVDLENDRRWEQAWNRLAVQYPQASAPPEKAKELRRENEELRQQLTAAKRQAEAAESRAGQEQSNAQMAKSQLDMAIKRAAMAESFLEWERKLSGSKFVSVTVQQLPRSVTEATITRWLKEEGDHVEADEPLLEIAVDGRRAYIHAPATGILRTAGFRAGKTVTIGTVLAVIDDVLVSSWPVIMPTLGGSLAQAIPRITEATITRWLKKEGERVAVDEPLLEVSTDKVDTEITSPASGVLHSIVVEEDETVAFGTQLAVIEGTRPPGHEPPAQEQHRQAMSALIMNREELERRIDDLVAFEREYRSRLKAYLKDQLRDLEASPNLTPKERLDDLGTFEREYRSRLKAYLEGQLRDLDTGIPIEAVFRWPRFPSAALHTAPPGAGDSGQQPTGTAVDTAAVSDDGRRHSFFRRVREPPLDYQG